MQRTGLVRPVLGAMYERALSRVTKGERLADKQLVPEMIAGSRAEMSGFRLRVLRIE
jgi:acyl-CoA dehydrogenase